MEAGWFPEPDWMFRRREKSFPLPEFEPWIVKPIV